MKLTNNGFYIFDECIPVHTWYSPVEQEDVSRRYTANPHRIFDEFQCDHIRKRALYFHIPFCTDNLCSFCTLHTQVCKSSDQIESYVKALLREIQIKARHSKIADVPVNAIFFGGGTPSILSSDQIRQIGEAIHRNFDTGSLKEFSFENNVKTITVEKLKALKDIGVTNVRAGVQSFNPFYRSMFQLSATLDQVYASVALCNEHFDNTSIDIIYGMNGQSLESFAKDIWAALSLQTRLIECYPLTAASCKTTLLNSFAGRKLQPKSEMEIVTMNIALRELMKSSGLLPHNGHGFVRVDDAELIRNPVTTQSYVFEYHKSAMGCFDGDVIGFGAGAASILSGHAIVNEGNVSAYQDQIESGSVKMRIYSNSIRANHCRAIMSHLPYFGYVDKADVDFSMIPRETLDRLKNTLRSGIVEETDSQYLLNHRGWYWHNNLMYYLSPQSERDQLDRMVAKRTSDPLRKTFMSDVAVNSDFPE